MTLCVQFGRRYIQNLSASMVSSFKSLHSSPPRASSTAFGVIPSIEYVERVRSSNLNAGLVTYYKKPLYITRGSMQWLWDHENKRYLDFFGGIVTVSVGHCHPKVNQALKNQLDQLWHTTNIYYHPKIHEYADRLALRLPPSLQNIYFVNSGSEANDMAMYMARLYTGNFEVISFRNAYHGMSPYTMGLTAQSSWKFNIPGSFGIHHAMNPDPYRGLFGGRNCRDSPVQTTNNCNCDLDGVQCEAASKYAEQFEELFRYSLPKGGNVAALFAESIQGVGGTVQYPKGFLKHAFERTRKAGGLCISDEVQTGFGRTGEHFWGFEGHDVIPDIVTMAKGIGNGFPLAAVATSKEIGNVMKQALHFNTYGGNPMSSAVGIAVLDAIDEDGCQENSLKVGTYILNGLAKIRDEVEIVGDVRGKGLMIGIEMVKDKSSKEPLCSERIALIWEELKEMGLLVGKGGLHGNVFRIKPPMCITMEDAEFSLDCIRRVVSCN